MCETCGCSLQPKPQIPFGADVQFSPRFAEPRQHSLEESGSLALLRGIMTANDQQAAKNRVLFQAGGTFVVNLMSSPGAGKTLLLESTVRRLKKNYRVAVIEGDLETENDANRIRAQGVAAVQIATGSACHLDADAIARAQQQLPKGPLDFLFIENVGNLVCPAAFDLGQHANIALLSTTEGDDKPLKYPVLFQKVDGLVLSKIELLQFFDDFSESQAIANFRRLANRSPVWSLSAKTGIGVDNWVNWLIDTRATLFQLRPSSSSPQSRVPDGAPS